MKTGVQTLVITVLLMGLVAPCSGADHQDNWQRRTEMAGWAAMFFATGCGTDLLARHDGESAVIQNYGEMGIELDQHRRAHATAGSIAASAYLTSGYLQWQLNREREQPAFRHRCHNALFLTTAASLFIAGAYGMQSTREYEAGHLDAGHDAGRIMERAATASCSLGFLDLLLFGGHDNASPLGFNIQLRD